MNDKEQNSHVGEKLTPSLYKARIIDLIIGASTTQLREIERVLAGAGEREKNSVCAKSVRQENRGAINNP